MVVNNQVVRAACLSAKEVQRKECVYVCLCV